MGHQMKDTVLFMLGKQRTLVLQCWKFGNSNDGKNQQKTMGNGAE